MDYVELGIAAGALMLAGLVHGTVGLGFPLIATPLLATVMDVRSAVLITLLPTVAVNVLSVLHGGRLRAGAVPYLPLAGWSFGFALLGALALSSLDPQPFKLALAAVILLYLNSERLAFVDLSFLARRPQLGMLVFGILAGLSAGSTNVMVPFLLIFALERGIERDDSVQLFNLCFLGGKLAQIAVFGHAGLLGFDLLLATAGGAVLAVAALLVGFRLRRHIAAPVYRRVLRHLLYVMSAVLVMEFALED